MAQDDEDAVITPEQVPPGRILLVDDSPLNRMTVEEFLGRTPCRIDSAENGRVAVEMFASGGYDLVLLDVQMPVMDGHQAARLMRRWELDHNRPPTPIIAVTAAAHGDERDLALDAGCNEHLTKPLDRDELLELVYDYLSMGREAAAAPPSAASSRGGGGLQSPAELAHLLPAFFAQMRGDLEAMAGAVARHDWPDLARLAHACKGHCQLFAHDPLAEVARDLERVAREGGGPQAGVLLSRLQGLFAGLEASR